MNIRSKPTPFFQKLLGILLVAALGFGTFVLTAPAYADEGEPPQPEKFGTRIDERLEICLEKLNEWYRIQDGNVAKANHAIQRVEDALTKAAELGLDTSEIEALMPGLYAAVDNAQAYHARAEQILSEHAGFNGGGKVVDRSQAMDTCRSAREVLATARDSLLAARDSVREIIELVRQMRQDYIPSTESVS
jgi:hypothetical protein